MVLTDQDGVGFTITDGVLTSYTGDAEEIQIASNVTRIEENAFLAENCPNLKTVYVTSESKVNIYIDKINYAWYS